MRKDLKLHFLVGAAIALVVGFFTIKLTAMPEPLAILFGLIVGVIAGWAKEYVYDKRRPDRHVVDPEDFKYTTLGAVFGAVVLSGLSYFLRG